MKSKAFVRIENEIITVFNQFQLQRNIIIEPNCCLRAVKMSDVAVNPNTIVRGEISSLHSAVYLNPIREKSQMRDKK